MSGELGAVPSPLPDRERVAVSADAPVAATVRES
jgi:hypothetical protein